MSKINEESLLDSIDPVWLAEIQKKGAERRKVKEMVEAILKIDKPKPKMSLGEYILTFPKIDCDDSIFARHPDRGNSDVPG